MFVADVFSSDGKNYAVCSGPGINKNMQIKRIKVAGSEYNVKEIRFFESFIGIMQVSLEVEGPLPIPMGEVSIFNSETGLVTIPKDTQQSGRRPPIG